jgi:hypothetical protein
MIRPIAGWWFRRTGSRCRFRQRLFGRSPGGPGRGRALPACRPRPPWTMRRGCRAWPPARRRPRPPALTAVETLSVWCPSPPVPQTSIALAGRARSGSAARAWPARPRRFRSQSRPRSDRAVEEAGDLLVGRRRRACARRRLRPRPRRAGLDGSGSRLMPAIRIGRTGIPHSA